MSFLDEYPLKWTRPETPQLRDLFVLAYRRPQAVEALADAAGIVPGTFPFYDNLRTTFTELLNVMAVQGKLRAMVEKAAEDPTIPAFKPRFVEMLQEARPAIPAVPSQEPGLTGEGWKGEDKDSRLARELHLERLMEKRSRLIEIGIAQRVTQVSKSIAKLTLYFKDEKAYGTGFLIQTDRILTNYHNVFHETHGEIEAITVEFDYEQGFSGDALVAQGNIGSIEKNAGHDWAVVRLEHAVDRQPIALGTPFHITKNDPVIIIQHPLGAFKQFAIDPISIQYVDQEIIQYVADTQKGSSGSPVFNIQMHPIALHHAEASAEIDVDGRTETIWRNEGIRMERIMEDLQSKRIEFASNRR